MNKVEKCQNFKRDTKGIYDVQWCRAKKMMVNCNGWSTSCVFPESFLSVRALPVNGTILFKK